MTEAVACVLCSMYGMHAEREGRGHGSVDEEMRTANKARSLFRSGSRVYLGLGLVRAHDGAAKV